MVFFFFQILDYIQIHYCTKWNWQSDCLYQRAVRVFQSKCFQGSSVDQLSV